MTFQRNIPQPGDLISVSQDNLLQNFQAINDSYNVNHVLFNLAGDGKHKFVEMPNQTAEPAGAASEITIFSRFTTLPATGVVELWYKRNAEANAFQLTGTNPTNATKGLTFLPGGLLLQWNTETDVVDNKVYEFLDFFSASPYSIIITPTRDATAVRSMYVKEGSVTAGQFAIRTSSANFNKLFWMAIGPGPV